MNKNQTIALLLLLTSLLSSVSSTDCTNHPMIVKFEDLVKEFGKKN